MLLPITFSDDGGVANAAKADAAVVVVATIKAAPDAVNAAIVDANAMLPLLKLSFLGLLKAANF